jgi:hypothetical protein
LLLPSFFPPRLPQHATHSTTSTEKKRQ